MDSNYWSRGRVSRRMLLRSSAMGGLGLAGAALIGCGGGDDSPSGTATGTRVVETPGAASDEQRGGTINMSFLRWTELPIPSFNLHTFVDFANLVNNRVAYLDPQTAELIPELAESWEQVDPTTLVIKIRKGVFYHDKAPANGREFDSEDLITTFESNAGKLDPDEAMVPRYTRRAIYNRVQSYNAVDSHTVEVKFSEPDSTFMKGQADVLLYAVAKEQWDIGWTDATKIAGTGAFMMESIQGDHDRARYVRNPNYWEKDEAGGALPYLDGFTQENIPDRSTLLGAFIAGTQDCYFTPTLAERESIRRSSPNSVYEKYKASQFGPFFLNPKQVPAFEDQRVRMALHLAIDRKAINDAWYGTEEGDWYYSGPLVSYHPEAIQPDEIQAMPGYNPDTKEADITEAKRLMEAAGFAETGFAFEMPQSAAAGRSYEYAIRMKDQLEKLWPLKIEIPIVDPGILQQMGLTGEVQAGFGGEQSEVAPARELFRYYHPEGVRNNRIGGYDNPDVTSKIEASFEEFDADAHNAILREVQDILNEDMPIPPLWLPSDATFTNPRIKNYVGRTGPGLSVSYHAVAQLAKHIWVEE